MVEMVILFIFTKGKSLSTGGIYWKYVSRSPVFLGDLNLR
jgi:hypothetical protein